MGDRNIRLRSLRNVQLRTFFTKDVAGLSQEELSERLLDNLSSLSKAAESIQKEQATLAEHLRKIGVVRQEGLDKDALSYENEYAEYRALCALCRFVPCKECGTVPENTFSWDTGGEEHEFTFSICCPKCNPDWDEEADWEDPYNVVGPLGWLTTNIPGLPEDRQEAVKELGRCITKMGVRVGVAERRLEYELWWIAETLDEVETERAALSPQEAKCVEELEEDLRREEEHRDAAEALLYDLAAVFNPRAQYFRSLPKNVKDKILHLQSSDLVFGDKESAAKKLVKQKAEIRALQEKNRCLKRSLRIAQEQRSATEDRSVALLDLIGDMIPVLHKWEPKDPNSPLEWRLNTAVKAAVKAHDTLEKEVHSYRSGALPSEVWVGMRVVDNKTELLAGATESIVREGGAENGDLVVYGPIIVHVK